MHMKPAQLHSVLLLCLLALQMHGEERGMTHFSVASKALFSSPRKSHMSEHLQSPQSPLD